MKSMKKAVQFLVPCYLFLAACSLLFADVPHTMNYKGKLTTSDGTALNGTDTLAFDIYDVSSGGSPLWGETLTVNIVNGLFDVQLGHIHELDLDFSVPYWMQLSISTDGGTTWEVFDTREELAPVSYAYRAIYADTAGYVEGGGGGGANELNDLNDVTISSPTRGDVLYYNGTNWVNLGAGTDGQVLTTHGPGADPTWETPSGGSIPSGVIVMWSGSYNDIPAGWHLCDGTNGTPDLRDKFIYGVNTTYGPGDDGDLGTTGGSTSHTHTYTEVPSHTHTASISPNPHTHRLTTYAPGGSIPGSPGHYQSGSDYVGSTFLSVTVNSTGLPTCTTDPASSVPPYYKLAFIMKL